MRGQSSLGRSCQSSCVTLHSRRAGLLMAMSLKRLGGTLLVGLAVGGATLASMRPDVAAADRANTSDTSVVNVEGMTCAGCAVAVKMAAGTVDGVTSVDVSLEDNQARVAYDPARTTPRAIAEAITKGTGFTAEPVAAVRN